MLVVLDVADASRGWRRVTGRRNIWNVVEELTVRAKILNLSNGFRCCGNLRTKALGLQIIFK